MKTYLVTGQAEYYVHVEANSPEQARKKALRSKRWSRTMNLPLQDVKVEEHKEPEIAGASQ